ncbi:hypothetical protein LT493_41870 [Streptomyces tricolor]|nr:hypothetical protein [Streptomyces tricolor]
MVGVTDPMAMGGQAMALLGIGVDGDPRTVADALAERPRSSTRCSPRAASISSPRWSHPARGAARLRQRRGPPPGRRARDPVLPVLRHPHPSLPVGRGLTGGGEEGQPAGGSGASTRTVASSRTT